MLETLRCPSCSTRFGLRADRVHAGIRRAQCFRCDTVFGIEDAVNRLLGLVPEAAPEVPTTPPPPVDVDPFALHSLLPEEEGESPSAPAASLPQPIELPPSLTLGDLEGAEEEIMEKTLINVLAPVSDVGLEASDSPYAANGPGFSSAKDAIAKLMGAPPVIPVQPKALGSRSSMDVEATLSALDNTLGGNRTLEPLPEEAPEALGMNMASTVKLTSKEIQAALLKAHPVIATVPSPSPASAQTAAMPRLEPVPPPPGPPDLQDPNLLKVQLEQETCNNVSLEQMSAWIEQGRVQEYHMVARQFSEHWIEASKVPALRPLFEQRKRRQGLSQEEMPIPPAEILPPKKGLFGGFFGRN